MSVDSPGAMSRGPRKLLVNDEGKSTLHFFDRDDPRRNWSHQGPGRDLQLIGQQRVLRSHPQGYVELDLASGAVAAQITIADLPGGVESARRLANGHTAILGNAGSGVFAWEVDRQGHPVSGRQQLVAGIEKTRMLRLTGEGTFLFCSETNGQRVIHELSWERGVTSLFEVPPEVPADSMVKAVRVAANVVTVSTGYAASLLRVDTARKTVLQTIGGKSQPEPPGGKRPLSPFFFSGYQMFENGDCLIANWQGHSPERNGQGYQLLLYNAAGALVWWFDQTAYPMTSSLNNIIVLDGLDSAFLHDEPNGVLIPMV
ncbi:MAG: hypothetical protein ABJA82_02915 [Myxococcales bacterium]